jgi:hypothetical protein
MKDTLLLDTVEWDLVVDAAGNLAVATAPYATAQNVATALRTFKGEVYYNTEQGIPYFTDILGLYQNKDVIRSLIETTALSVEGVTAARCLLNEPQNRVLQGSVIFTDENGNEQNLEI